MIFDNEAFLGKYVLTKKYELCSMVLGKNYFTVVIRSINCQFYYWIIKNTKKVNNNNEKINTIVFKKGVKSID